MESSSSSVSFRITRLTCHKYILKVSQSIARVLAFNSYDLDVRKEESADEVLRVFGSQPFGHKRVGPKIAVSWVIMAEMAENGMLTVQSMLLARTKGTLQM